MGPRRPSRTFHPGVCGESGFGCDGIQVPRGGSGGAELFCGPVVESLAVRIHEGDTVDAGAGVCVHGFDGDGVADREPRSGSQHVMAFYEYESGCAQEAIQADDQDGGGQRAGGAAASTTPGAG